MNAMSAVWYKMTKKTGFYSSFRPRVKPIENDNFWMLPDLETSLGDQKWEPQYSTSEKDGAYQFQVEVPGSDVDHLKVEVDARKLVIEGERRDGGGESIKRFSYTWAFQDHVDEHFTTAHFRGGILEVIVPKETRPRLHSIPISVSPSTHGSGKSSLDVDYDNFAE